MYWRYSLCNFPQGPAHTEDIIRDLYQLIVSGHKHLQELQSQRYQIKITQAEILDKNASDMYIW